MTADLQSAIGTAVPGVVLICIGCFSPLALFKLLSFVDPGTSSGSALRAGLAAQGGLSGLLSGRGDTGSATSAAASSTDDSGRSQAETSGEDSTSARFASGLRGGLTQAGGIVGQVAGTGLGVMVGFGGRGAAVAAGLTNQMGVGHNTYVPDFSATRQRGANNGRWSTSEDDNPAVNGSGPTGSPDPGITSPAWAPSPYWPGAAASGSSGGGAGGGGGPAGSGAGAAAGTGGDAAAAASAVPIVPV